MNETDVVVQTAGYGKEDMMVPSRGRDWREERTYREQWCLRHSRSCAYSIFAKTSASRTHNNNRAKHASEHRHHLKVATYHVRAEAFHRTEQGRKATGSACIRPGCIR